jgi:hypothetical protein
LSYLCVDVEWNYPVDPAEPVEMLSIGASCWDSVHQRSRTFFRLIKPERMELITPSTFRLLKVGQTVLDQAKPCGEILAAFDRTFFDGYFFKGKDAIVFWNLDAWLVFKSQMDRYGFKLPSRRIVILQDVLHFADKSSLLGRIPGFEAALQMYHVPYRRELLHNSKYDASYLIDLYDAAYDRLTDLGDKNAPLVHTRYSRTLHHPSCRYLKGKQAIRGSWADALNGWPLCICCGRYPEPKALRPAKKKKAQAKHANHSSKQSKSKALREARPLDEAAFEEFCESLDIACQFSVGWVLLRTPVSFWKIQHDGTRVLNVLHESLRVGISTAEQKSISGFHQQEVFDKDIFETAQYIYEHDKHFLSPKYVPSYWGKG